MKYKMVAFGLGTLVNFGSTTNAWDFVRSKYSLPNFWQEYLNRKISRQEAKLQEYKAWKENGVKKDKLLMEFKKNTKFVDGVREAFTAIKSKGSVPVILSDSPLIVVDDVAVIVGAKYTSGNKIFFDKDGYAYDTVPTHPGPDGRVSKHLALKDFAEKEEIKLNQIAIVTSNPEDISLFRLLGFSIAFNPQSPDLKRSANITVHSKDLSEVVDYL